MSQEIGYARASKTEQHLAFQLEKVTIFHKSGVETRGQA